MTTLGTFERAGLAALARAGDRQNWFAGHFGAAMISGEALLRDSRFPEPARDALGGVLRSLVEASPDWFGPPRSGGTPASYEPLLDALRRDIGTSRTSGHPTIYAVAALRCFARDPSAATERVVSSIVALHECAQTSDDPRRYYGFEDYFEVDESTVPAVADIDTAIRLAVEAWEGLVPDDHVDGHRHFFTGEKFHLLTHAHALDVLVELGYPELARDGLRAVALQLYLTAKVPPRPRPLPEPFTYSPRDLAFWSEDGFDPWHKIKLAEATERLLPRLTTERRTRAEHRLGQIWSLLGISVPSDESDEVQSAAAPGEGQARDSC